MFHEEALHNNSEFKGKVQRLAQYQFYFHCMEQREEKERQNSEMSESILNIYIYMESANNCEHDIL